MFGRRVWVFLIYIWMKKCVEIRISVFKMLKRLLKMGYQIGPKCVASVALLSWIFFRKCCIGICSIKKAMWYLILWKSSTFVRYSSLTKSSTLFFYFFIFCFLLGNPFYPKHSWRTTASLEGLQTNIVYTNSSLDDPNHPSGEGGFHHLSFHGLLGPGAKFHPLPFLAYTIVAHIPKLHTN